MDCPFCGKELQEGRIPSRGTLEWYDSASEDIWPKGIRLSEGFQDTRAFFCPDCRQIVIPVPETESAWDKVQRKIGAASEKLGAMREQLEERRTQAVQAKKQKEKEKLGTKDPWEL